jgi:hypothetical protein
MRAEGKSLRGTAAERSVSALLLSRWEVQKVGEMDPCNKLFKSKKKANLPGPLRQLEAIKEPLLRYIFEMRKQGVIINSWGVALRASYLSPEFREKSFTARVSAVKHWLVTHSMSYRMGTHTGQRPPAKVESKACKYMAYMRRIVLGGNRDRRFILNMDQMQVFFFDERQAYA